MQIATTRCWQLLEKLIIQKVFKPIILFLKLLALTPSHTQQSNHVQMVRVVAAPHLGAEQHGEAQLLAVGGAHHLAVNHGALARLCVRIARPDGVHLRVGAVPSTVKSALQLYSLCKCCWKWLVAPDETHLCTLAKIRISR